MNSLARPLVIAMGSLWLSAGLCACSGGVDQAKPATDVRLCGAPSPCEPFFIEDCGGMDCGQTAYLENQSCALDALRKGEPALLDISSGCEGMCAGDFLLLRGDGTVVKQPYFDEFNDRKVSAPFLCKLANVGIFEACLEEFDKTCLSETSWVSGCQEATSFLCE